MSEFNITGRLLLSGIDVEPHLGNLKKKLASLKVPNINIGTQNAKNINETTKSLDRLVVSTQKNLSLTEATAGASNKAGRAVTTMGQGLNKASSSMEDFADKSGLALRRFAAFSIAAGGVLKGLQAITSGVKSALDFEREMLRVTQVTRALPEDIDKLRSSIGGLSASFGTGAGELVEAAKVLSQAGFSLRDVQTALGALAESTLAPTFTSTIQTTEALVAITRQFGVEADGLRGALGQINAVSAQYAIEADDLTKAVQKAGGAFAASSAGIYDSNEALARFFALITSVRSTTRESAEQIGTGLRTITTRLQRPETLRFFRDMNVDLVDARGNFIGTFDAIQKIAGALDGLSSRNTQFAVIAEKIGGARQISRVIPLLTQTRLQTEALNKALAGQDSIAGDAALAQANLAVRISEVHAEFITLIRDITNTDAFQTMARQALDVASSIISVVDSIKEVIPYIAALGTAALALKIAPVLSRFVGSTFSQHGPGVNLVGGSRVSQFKKGGKIPGTGFGDKIPVLAEPGEFMVSKDAVNAFGLNNLKAINNIQHAENGGLFGNSKFRNVGDVFSREARERGATSSSIDKVINQTAKEFSNLDDATEHLLKRLEALSEVSTQATKEAEKRLKREASARLGGGGTGSGTPAGGLNQIPASVSLPRSYDINRQIPASDLFVQQAQPKLRSSLKKTASSLEIESIARSVLLTQPTPNSYPVGSSSPIPSNRTPGSSLIGPSPFRPGGPLPTRNSAGLFVQGSSTPFPPPGPPTQFTQGASTPYYAPGAASVYNPSTRNQSTTTGNISARLLDEQRQAAARERDELRRTRNKRKRFNRIRTNARIGIAENGGGLLKGGLIAAAGVATQSKNDFVSKTAGGALGLGVAAQFAGANPLGVAVAATVGALSGLNEAFLAAEQKLRQVQFDEIAGRGKELSKAFKSTGPNRDAVLQDKLKTRIQDFSGFSDVLERDNGGLFANHTGALVGATGGALAGASQGAVIGAAIGSIVPGIGTALVGAIGGVVGAAGGAISGAIAGEAVQRTGSGVANAFRSDGQIARNKKRNSAINNEANSFEFAKIKALGLFGGGQDLQDKVVARFNKKKVQKSVEEFGGTAGSARDEIRRLIESGQSDKITKELRVNSSLDSVDFARTKSITLAVDASKEREAVIKKEVGIRDTANRIMREYNNSLTIIRDATARVSDSLGLFSQQLSASTAIGSNISSRAIGGVAEATGARINPFANIGALSQSNITSSINQLEDSSGGRIGERTRGLAQLSPIIDSLGPSILRQSKKVAAANGEGNLVESSRSAIRDVVDRGPLSSLPADLKQAFLKSFENIDSKKIREFNKTGDIAPLLGSLKQPIQDTVEQLRQMADASNKFQDALVGFSNQRAGLLQKAFSLTQNRLAATDANRTVNAGILGQRISPDEVIARRDRSVQVLTRGPLDAVGSSDPATILSKIGRLESERTRINSSPLTDESTKRLSEVNAALGNNKKALEILAGSVGGLAAIQQKLATLEQKRQSAQSGILNAAFSTPEQAAADAKSRLAFNAFQKGGGGAAGFDAAQAAGFNAQDIGRGKALIDQKLANDPAQLDAFNTKVVSGLSSLQSQGDRARSAADGAFNLKGQGPEAVKLRTTLEGQQGKQIDAIDAQRLALAAGIEQFDQNITKTFNLGADAFKSVLENINFPDRIDVVHSEIQINMNGGEVFGSLEPLIKDKIKESVDAAIAQYQSRDKEGQT